LSVGYSKELPRSYLLPEYLLLFEIVKKNLPDILLLAAGLLVMALLMYVIAASQGWISLLGILALAAVWISWYRHLLRLAFRSLGVDPDDEDDLPSFPG
jgi:hypothetical protein